MSQLTCVYDGEHTCVHDCRYVYPCVWYVCTCVYMRAHCMCVCVRVCVSACVLHALCWWYECMCVNVCMLVFVYNWRCVYYIIYVLYIASMCVWGTSFCI